MSRTQFLSLIALNAVLLAALALVSLSGSASAQQRQRGSYMLISGGVTGTPLSVVYVIDETNNELVALAWDDAGKKAAVLTPSLEHFLALAAGCARPA